MTLSSALDIIIRLEPVEDDQTHYLTESYTADTPQSLLCGCIAQSVLRIDELTYFVVGGAVGDYGEATIKHLNYTAILAHAVKAIQELREVIKQQQLKIYELRQRLA